MKSPAILLDSGAYSASTQGVDIDLDAYINFIKFYQSLIDRYVSLDVIRDGKQSYRNHQRMKAAGLTPIPVFHRSERFQWLEKYLADGEPWIALSPALMLHPHPQVVTHWLDDCFSLLSDAKGRPLVDVHGLGLSAADLCHGYQWTSVDSRTWLQAGAYGKVPLPRYVDGRPDYRSQAKPVSVSTRSPGARRHIDRLSGFDFDRLCRFLKVEVGISLEQARYDMRARQRAWVKYLQGMAASAQIEIAFVTDTSDPHLSWVLRDCGARLCLVSYDALRNRRNPFADFTAATRPPPPRPPRVDFYCDTYWDWRALMLLEHIEHGMDEDASKAAPANRADPDTAPTLIPR